MGSYNGPGPSNPPNRKPRTTTARMVDKIKVRLARLFQIDRHRSPWDRFRYQSRSNMRKFRPNTGHMSACNAGVTASTAAVLPNRPIKPGTIHHQGNGEIPLNGPMKGVSILNNPRI